MNSITIFLAFLLVIGALTKDITVDDFIGKWNYIKEKNDAYRTHLINMHRGYFPNFNESLIDSMINTTMEVSFSKTNEDNVYNYTLYVEAHPRPITYIFRFGEKKLLRRGSEKVLFEFENGQIVEIHLNNPENSDGSSKNKNVYTLDPNNEKILHEKFYNSLNELAAEIRFKKTDGESK